MGDEGDSRKTKPWTVGNRPTVKPADAASKPIERCDAKGEVSPGASTASDVADFIRRMQELPKSGAAGEGRLVFAMDATMSRQPTWDMALQLQADMFTAVKTVGGLDVQLVYFRGAGECRASRWVSDPEALSRLMTSVDCRGGYTQIGKVLTHARRETETKRVHALVFVGDAMEEEADDLCGRAGELALLGVPVFLFQEGNDRRAERTFREIARITRGAWCRFDHGSADQLRELLSAVAVYAAGGRTALERLAIEGREGRRGAQLLLGELKRP